MKKVLLMSVLVISGVIILNFGLEARGRNSDCREDFKKYCSQARGTRDRQAMRECIDENYDNFSDKCKQAINSRREKRDR